MSLIKCPECGASISSAAENCPECGAPINRTVIKEKFGFSPLIYLALIVAGSVMLFKGKFDGAFLLLIGAGLLIARILKWYK